MPGTPMQKITPALRRFCKAIDKVTDGRLNQYTSIDKVAAVMGMGAPASRIVGKVMIPMSVSLSHDGHEVVRAEATKRKP